MIPAALYGTMHGEVVTVWLNAPQQAKVGRVSFWRRESRRMRLHPDTTLVFERSDGDLIPAQIGLEFDGGSIPVWAWWLIGSPFTGTYREAAVIHDTLCAQKTRPAKDCHRIMFEACRALGVSRVRARLIYIALLIGGSKW